MATLMIRNLDESVKRRLRVQAAERGVSMEEEARVILRQALAASNDGGKLTGPKNSPTWHLRMSLEDIVGLGIRTDSDFDQKQAFDDIYDYLDDE